jgi:HEAT repeat protein
LGQIGTASAVPWLIAALKSDSWVRCAVARSLGQIGTREALQTLMQLVNDEDITVAFIASRAFVEAGKNHNVPPETRGEKKLS